MMPNWIVSFSASFYLAFDSTDSAEYYKLKDRIYRLRQEWQLRITIIYYLANAAGDV